MTDDNRPSPSEFLERVRSEGGEIPVDMIQYVEPRLVPHQDWGNYDENGQYRKEVVRPLIGSVNEQDRTLILYLLKQELEAAHAEAATSEARRLFSYLLSRIGKVEDALVIWHAKESSFDGFNSVDVQFAVGAGVEETLRFLDQQQTEMASYAAKYIRSCKSAGDFENLAERNAILDREDVWF